MSKKGILSFLLAIVMIATNFTQVFAYNPAGSSAKGSKELSVKTVEDRRGNKKNSIEISQLEGTKTTRSLGSSLLRYARFANQQSGTRSAEETWDAEINVNISTFGIGGQSFDWDEVFGKGETFTVQAFYYDADGQRINVGTPQTVNKGGKNLIFTATLPKSATSINLETSFIDKIGIKAYERSDNGVGDGNGKYAIDLELHQIYNPVINVMWLNPYGTKVRGAGDAKASFNDVEFNIIDSNRQMNLRDEDILVKGADGEPEDFIDVQDLTDLTGKNIEIVDANEGTVTYGDRTFKVTVKNPTAKDPGEIKFIEQPKIITPGDNDKPGNVAPDGYKRLSFHAESAANAQDGLFNDTTKVKIIDVLEGTKFNDAELLAKVGTIAKPYPVINGKKDANKKFLKWNPALPTDKTTGDVADTNYWPVYIANGDKIDENDKLPEGAFKVKVVRDEKSIQEDKLYGQTYAVFDGKTLAGDKFPELKAADNYRNPKWMTDAAEAGKPMEKIDAPWTKVIKKDTTFKATAAEDAATQIGQNGLKAVDTTALQGQDLTEAFWHEGVALGNTVRDEDKANFAALLKEATVTDLSNRTSEKVEDQVGTLLVTFKDGSTLKVENQKLIVKPNTVTVELDKDAQGAEKPLRDGDTVVKGKVTANATENKENGYKVSLEGAVVTIKDKAGKTIGVTLADKDGNFTAGTRELKAGEDISVVVTLPESKTESAPVTEKVQLNPDKLNAIIPTGEAVVKNFEGKKGVDQEKVTALKNAIKKATDDLVEKDGKVKAGVTVDATGQKSLDDQYEAIKKTIEALTGNTAPEITGTSHKEIFKGDALNLEEGITVSDADGENDIALQGGKTFTYKVEKIGEKGAKEAIQDPSKINETAGTYEVTYTVKDKSGAEGTFVMTLVVKEKVVKIKDNFPEVIPEGYVKVEFKPGDHGKLDGTTKFLVKDGSEKTVLNPPTIKPNPNYEAKAGANWAPEIPATFTGTEENNKSFTFTAQYTYTGNDVVEQKPGDKKPDVPDNFVKVEFKKGEHGVISSEETTIYWVNPKKEVSLTAPTVTPSHGYKHTGWNPEVKANTKYTAAQEFVAQYKATVVTEDPNDAEHYAKLTFEKGDHGDFAENAKTSIWVLKGEKVQFNAPKVNAKDGFTFAGWDPELKESYDADQTHTAQYASNSDISDTEVKGFQEVKFLSGTDGKFEGDKTEKSVWVRPGKLVDLRTKAPKVTVTTKGKSFIGWDKDLVQTFTKADQPTVITAKYGDTVKTTEPDAKDKEKYAKVDFVAGNLGTIADDATKTYWVVKDAEVTLTPPTVTAKDGWKINAEKPWDPAVANKYTQDTIHVAQYDYDGASVIPQKPGEDKPVVPENFVKVEFKKGDHGVISSEETTVYWVDPTKEVELTAPKVIADTNYKHIGWKNGDAVVDLTKANKFEKATDIVAQYKATVVTEDPKDENYVTVEFKAGDHGTLVGDAKFWVYKNEKVSITAPKVTAKDGYVFDKWDPAVKDSYAEATVHNATYTTNNNVSDTPVEGYYKVTFKAGDHGTLSEEKSVWVKPDTLVDLTDKAPEVTPAEGYSHIGWKPALIGKFANGTEIVAQYSNSISDKPVEGWTEILFNSGEHGRFKDGTKNTVWVNPDKAVSLDSYMKDKIVANTNYSFDKWQDAKGADADLATPKMYKEATSFTATYKSNVLGKDEYEKLPEDEKKNFVQITFNEGDHGKFPKEAVKEVYVKKDVVVDLTEKAPTVIPNQGYGHSGWEPALKSTFSAATTITAQYKAGTFDENAIKEIMVVGPTKMGYGEGEKLDLTGLKVIAKDDAGLQKTYDGVDAIKAARFNIAPADKIELKMEDNGKHIVVTKGEGNDKVTGQTETTLTIHENKSAKAEDVKALNQNKVVDGKVTNEPKDTTTVTGKVKPGSTVVIKDESGKNITPKDGVKVENGTFTAEVEKQGEGKKVQVIVTEPGKQPADPADATVARDANNDGKADGDADQKTATPTAKALNQGEDPKVTTITGKAEKGATVIAKVDGKEVGRATADAQTGEYKIEAKQNEKPLGENTEVKVTAQVEGKLESEPATATVKIDKDGNGVADDEEQFDIKKATKVEIIKNPDKMKYAVKTKDGTTPFDATGVIIRLTDGSGKSKTYTYKDITEGPDKGKFTLSPADAEQIGLGEEGKVNTIPFKVTVKGADTKPSVTAEQNITVILDADGNGVDDRTEETAEPNVMARNIGKDPQKTTVEIETQPKAKVTIEYTDKDGQPKKIENLTAGDDGKLIYDKITPALKAGTDVKVTVQDGDKKPTEKTVKVFDDLDDNKIPDTQAGQTERPSALAYNFKDEAKTTIKGEAEPGSKVVAKVGDVKVGEATANSDGQYEISAIKDGAKLPKGTKVSVTATLDPKKPSSAQETVVYDDLDGDGQPDTAQAFDKDKIREFEVVASPNKMVYNNKEKLDLTGMKVKLTDQMGNMKLVEFSEFEAYGIKVSPLNGVELSDKNVADGGNNGQKIKAQVNVTIGNNQKTYSDETPTALKVNKDQSAQPTDVLAANQGDKATTTVKGKATPGAKVEVKNAKGDVIGTVDQVPNNGEFQVEVTKQADKAKVTVTATETGKAESAPQEATVIRDKDGDWKEDGGKVELEKPVVDTVKVGDESVKVQTPGEGITKITVKDESGKTIEVVKDGNDWKVDGKPVGKDGDKLVIPTKDKKLIFGPNETVEITNHDAEGNEGKTVVATKPANLKPMENPTIDPISTESKKVTGKALPGSVVKVTLPGSTVPQEALVKSDGSFELVLEKPLADKAVVEVTATNSQREGVGKAKATVGLNLQELEKTKAEADGLINDSKTGNNFDPNNKYDKNLEEKTKAAQDIIDKAKDNKDDNDPTQTQVNKAEEDLRDAINQKNADDKVKVVEKAVKDGQKPSEEQIKKAQDAIDKVTDPAAKKELQDRLDKAKLIDQLVDDVKNAPKKGDKGYDTKPADVIKTLEDAKKEAEKVINDYKQGTNTAGKTPEKAKEDLDKAIEEYNKEQVVVGVAVPSAGFNSLSITSLQPNVKITIFVDGKAQLTDKNLSTSPTGKLVVSLDKPLESGQKVEIIGSKAGLMDGGASVTTP
ncbi:hypothetical protein PEPCOX59622_00952 [Aedoeadaptatus coxii]|uniref:Ig-like domain-containing protein n=1 Tax=Aedoeadaptatus coxii TaxID=755172 RepID=UPI0017770917|nr:Ig-like domain-containing protein [Peptoniphilus coxii]CAC9931669.1 hypothetical protein PEPCOX59622_00952 [Peptoniphilus coxii]